MTEIRDLGQLLKNIKPELNEEEFVFCSVPGCFQDYLELKPLASFTESEGLTLILSAKAANVAGLPFQGTYKQITLTVHSSLDAVGLTAAVANKLANKKISANVVAAYYHDHIFVPSKDADAALLALKELST